METINIKGREYVPVNERIKEFWKRYPDGNILTSMISNVDGVCIFKVEVYTHKGNVIPSTTGYAYEKETSSFINKTSYIENCETSAVGRALGILGIGIDTSVASAEEVDNAITQQNSKIDNLKQNALKKAIENAGITKDEVNDVLAKFGYMNITDINIADYMEIVKEFQKIKGDK